MTCKVYIRNCDADNPFRKVYRAFCRQSLLSEKLTEEIASLIRLSGRVTGGFSFYQDRERAFPGKFAPGGRICVP